MPGNGLASGDCDLLSYLACLNEKKTDGGNANAVEELKVAEINLQTVARVPRCIAERDQNFLVLLSGPKPKEVSNNN